jgi:hypothetical protein
MELLHECSDCGDVRRMVINTAPACEQCDCDCYHISMVQVDKKGVRYELIRDTQIHEKTAPDIKKKWYELSFIEKSTGYILGPEMKYFVKNFLGEVPKEEKKQLFKPSVPDMFGLSHCYVLREYLDYLESHLKNVSKAWLGVQNACHTIPFLSSESNRDKINWCICRHDLSKLSHEEFTQYAYAFYWKVNFPNTMNWLHNRGEINLNFQKALTNHKIQNDHHWENIVDGQKDWEIKCVHMVVDWIAMAYRDGTSARDWYKEKIRQKEIDIPDKHHLLAMEILDLMYLPKGD